MPDPDTFAATFATRFADLLGDRRVADLAADLDVSESAVRNWLKGQKTPNGRLLYALCLYFGVSADWLLGLVEVEDA